MSSATSSAGWVFRGAAAVIAAAVADPIIEGLSNAGVFGPGRFTDHSNIDVIPALCIALGLLLILVALLARGLIKEGPYPPKWVRSCAVFVGSRSLWNMLPSTYLMQMIALFGMETLEQIATAGHPLGAMVWLGGPVAASMIIHGISCVVFTWALSRIVVSSARTIARAVRQALELLRALLVNDAPAVAAYHVAACRFIEPYLRALQGRAPPILSRP